MNFDAMKRQLRSARLMRNVLAASTAVMTGVAGLLAFEIATQSHQVVLIPTNVSDGMVARGAVDKRYVEALALDAVYGLYNASPESLEYGRRVIERLASVGQRNELLKHYDEVAKDISDRDISTVFRPRTIEHNLSKLEVVVDGDLETFLNTVMVKTEPRRILLSFVTEAGSVRLARINKLEDE